MKEIQINNYDGNDKYFGIEYLYKDKTRTINDCFSNGIKLPLGEAMLTIIESIDFMTSVLNSKIEDISHSYHQYFTNRNYDLTELIINNEIDAIEIEKLNKIKEYIEICNNGKEIFCTDSIETLACSILGPQHDLMYLFNIVDYTKIRKYTSNVELPFSTSTDMLVTMLIKKYISFSFRSETQYRKLSELCIISLYEIASLGYLVGVCENCGHFYISTGRTQYCSRKLLDNDFTGCGRFRMKLTSKEFSSKEAAKLYKKLYNKLHNRVIKSMSLEEQQRLEEFKNGWKKIRILDVDSKEKEDMLYTFLHDERWQ